MVFYSLNQYQLYPCGSGLFFMILASIQVPGNYFSHFLQLKVNCEEINSILDPIYKVNFPPRGTITDLPDRREKLPGLCHPGIQTEGGANQVAKHVIQPFCCYMWLRISNIFLTRKSIIIRMLPVTYIEYLPYTGSII